MQETVPDNISPEDMMMPSDIKKEQSITDSTDVLIDKMNDKLMHLQDDGTVLNRRDFSFSEKRSLAKVAKTKKKLDRLKKKQKKHKHNL